MPDVSVFLRTVHDTVHVFDMKRAFSEPKIYTGGTDAKSWSQIIQEHMSHINTKHSFVQ